jgi:DNA-binding GntR family transcriptional regulator
VSDVELPQVDNSSVDASTSLSGSEHITRSKLSEQIAERLRNDIVHGRIAAGTHLIQDELCDRFGTSRMPVRDALQQLTHEGILELQGLQRVVVSLGAEELEDVHALIAVLHGWAAGRAAEVASEAELAELAAFCDSTSKIEDPYEFGRMGMEFHRRINVLARSPRLLRTLANLEQTVPQAMPFTIPNELANAKIGHQAIVSAIQSRDARNAEEVTRSISMSYVALLVKSLGHRLPHAGPPDSHPDLESVDSNA